MSEKKDPCERYCSSCAWPVECAADEACRRREAGEVRSVYPGSDRFLAGSGAAAQPHELGSRLRGKIDFIGVDEGIAFIRLAAGPVIASEFHAGPVVITPLRDPGDGPEALRERANRFIHNSVTRGR